MTKHSIRHILVLTISSVACLILWEISIRYLHPQKIVPSITSSVFGIPNALKANIDTLSYLGRFPYRITTNSNHIRSDKEISYKKKPGTYRILCLGGSIFFGYGNNNGETFPHYLEKILNKHSNGIHFEVINAAVPGWGYLEYVPYFKNEGYKYNSDLVIISQFADDIRQAFAEKTDFKKITIEDNIVQLEGMRFSSELVTWPARLMGFLNEIPLYNRLSQTSHLLYLIRFNLNKILDNNNLWEPQNVRLDQFIKSIQAQKIEELIWKQGNSQFNIPRDEDNPIYFYGNKTSLSSETIHANTVLYFLNRINLFRIIEEKGAKIFLLKIPTFNTVLKMVQNPKIPSKKQDESITKLDLLEPFSQFSKLSDIPIFYPFDNHWTPAGSRLAAQITYNFLISKHITPVSPSLPNSMNIYDKAIISTFKKANYRIHKDLTNDPFQVFVEAMRYKNINRFDMAEKRFKYYIKLNPENPEAYFQLGLIYLMGKKFSEAESSFFQILGKGSKFEKENYENYYHYAKIFGKAWPFIQKGELKKALPFLQDLSLLESPFQKEANNIIALHYLKIGDIEQAKSYRKKANNKISQEILRQKMGLGRLN